MLKQVWFSSNEEPLFSEEDRELYRTMVENQELPIGNIVDGRHLLRCMTDDFESIKAFLIEKGKAPIVCGVRYQDGSWDEAYPKNEAEFEKFFAPDSDGNIPADNTSAGWPSFREIVES